MTGAAIRCLKERMNDFNLEILRILRWLMIEGKYSGSCFRGLMNDMLSGLLLL